MTRTLFCGPCYDPDSFPRRGKLLPDTIMAGETTRLTCPDCGVVLPLTDGEEEDEP